VKLATRIGIIIFSCSLGTLLVGGFGLHELKAGMLAERQAQIENLLKMAVTLFDQLHAQETAGTLSREEARKRAADSLSGLRNGNSYMFARDAEDRFVAHVNPARIGKVDKGTKMPDGRFIVEIYRDELGKQGEMAFVNILQAKPGAKNDELSNKLNGVTVYKPWGWTIGTGFFTDDIDLAYQRYAFQMLAVGLLVLAGSIGFAVVSARKIYAQLGGEPEYAAKVVSAVAQGNLSSSLIRAPEGSLISELGKMQESVRAMIGTVRTQALSLNEAAHRINDTMADITRASEASADATSATAASVEQMVVSIGMIAESAKETEAHASRSVGFAGEGDSQVAAATQEIQQISRLVDEAATRMAQFAERTTQIGSMAKEIKEIADQTNLLALNAAIEAARAGDVGRGFAVVAEEVGKLAKRTTSATQSISETIKSIQSGTDAMVQSMHAIGPRVTKGAELAHAASSSLRSISEGADATLAEIREVAHATAEQSTVSASIASQVEKIASMADTSDRAVHEAKASVASLSVMAEDINSALARFRVTTEHTSQ